MDTIETEQVEGWSLHFGKEAEAAQAALAQRPKFSIRLRIALGFLVIFFLFCVVTLTAMIFVYKLDKKLRFLENAGNYAFEIQQTRRFEKNYFLYGTDLYDALNHVHTAQHLLDSYSNDFRSTIGDHAFEEMSSSLARYKDLLEQLQSLKQDPADQQAVSYIASELRRFGAQIVANASDAIDQERLRIHTWISTSLAVAVMALVLILLVEIYLATFITRQIIQPFSRFERYTQRIAAGDFSPITPTRRFRDEFTNLAIAINHMLRKLKEHEEQLIQSRKMAAIGTLTAGIAHELNNPLNNISMTTEALIEDFDSWSREEKLKMLHDIFTQMERASSTVANLLDFTHKDEVSFSRLSLKDVIARTLRLVENELAIDNIKLNLDMQNNLPEIMGNQHNLQQVFLNLILNAIQAMPEGGELTIRSSVSDTQVRVDVCDTGMGIPAENLEKIFDPFFTTKEVSKGTGLGLSVSFAIIQKHHGSLTVESEPGKGSVFSVTLPIA